MKPEEDITKRLPEEWQIARFADVAHYSLGRTPPRKVKDYWSEGEFDWVTIADMAPFSTIKSTSEKVSARAAKEIFQSAPVPKGTLLMSFKLTIGRTSILGVDAYHNEAIISISPKNRIHRDFLQFYLPTINFANHQDRAVKGQTLNKGKIDSLPVPVPPLPEQGAIAAVLSKIQAAVEVQEKIVSTLKELKSATMVKLFREGLGGEPLKQTEIGKIPESWEVRPLGNLGQVSTGTTPSTANPEYYVGDVPFLKTAEIDNNIITKSQSHISHRAIQDYNLQIYPAGSIFLAMYGQGKTRGRASLLGIPATTTQNTAAIEPNLALNSEYLWHYLLSQYEALRGMGNLGHLSHLNLGYVKELLIPVPSIEEQAEIKTVLSRLQIRAEIANQRYQELTKLFSSMLHLLMTGQVRVTQAMPPKS